MEFSQGTTIASLEPNRLPNGVENEAWETLLVSRCRLGGHGGGHKEVWKAVGNVVGTRADFRSGADAARVVRGQVGGRSAPWVLAPFGAAAVFSSRRNAHPAQPVLCASNKKCHFQ